MQHQKTSEEEAALQLSRVAPFLDRGAYKTAINGAAKIPGLKKMSDDYLISQNGFCARGAYRKAAVLIMAGKQEYPIDGRFLPSEPVHDWD